ncbi:hypothetical protein, partial [uncultured Arcanobacterium sp.]|uniref:hypothetical protein n=1 Tax=uncultured Arcanobacterium sp. TaxID=487520 RepID=UPI002608F525
LDLPSRWVLATALERLCKVQLKDVDISQAGTIADLMKLIMQDFPPVPDSALVSPSTTGGSANSGAENAKSTATETDALAAATAELANFFNN